MDDGERKYGHTNKGRSAWSTWRRCRRIRAHQDKDREFLRINEIFIELYEQLVEEVSSLKLDAAEKEAFTKMLQESVTRNRIDASKVYKLEMLVIDKLDLVQLRLRIISLREILQGLLTKEAWTLTDAALCKEELAFAERPVERHEAELGRKRAERQDQAAQHQRQDQDKHRDPDEAQDHAAPPSTYLLDLARAQAKALATRIYRRYVLVPAVEKRRTAIVIKLLKGMLAAWVFACLFHVLLHLDPLQFSAPSLPLIAIMSGATGATVSVIRRFYRIDPLHEPLLTWLSIERGALSIYISPLIGAVFGIVLLAIGQAGLLTGPLMPDLACAMGLDPAIGKSTSAPTCWPLTQFAKVALIGFVAGWGERIVPDVLNKLESRSGVGMEKS